jgi:uncharacterized membrane protein
MTAQEAAPRGERGTGQAGRRLVELTRQAPGLVAIGGMAVAGIGILAYLTTVHYANVPLLCPTTGLINCAQVTSSAYSVVPGTAIPITIPGMLWFVVSGGLAVAALRSLWRGQAEPARLRVAQLVWSALGLLVALYLVYAELVVLRKICEWCTVAHVLIFATLLVALVRWQRLPELEAVARSAGTAPSGGATHRANGAQTATPARPGPARSAARGTPPAAAPAGARRRANGKARTRR